MWIYQPIKTNISGRAEVHLKDTPEAILICQESNIQGKM